MANQKINLFCELCSLEFEKKVWYDIHLKVTHGTEIIKVKEEKLLPSEMEARNIKKSLQNKLDGPFLFDKVPESKKKELMHYCLICNAGFKSKSNLNQHKASVHDDEKVKCNLCDVKLKRNRG